MADRIDLRPFSRLHSFVFLRDLIRKWWKLELFLADATGEPVWSASEAERPPRPFTPDNDFCRLSLHAPLGARRCTDSAAVVAGKLREAGRGARCLVHECHLGFDVIACSLWLDGVMAGLVGVSGAVHEPWSSFGETQLLRKLRDVVPAAGHGTDLERALRRIPFLARGEIEQLSDLLLLCAEEIQTHHGELRRQPGPPADPASQEELLGTSLAIQTLSRHIAKIGGSAAAVLIRGEEGTGKQLLARIIHRSGPRRDQPLLVQNCSLFGADLLMNALFGTAESGGHRRGLLAEAAGGSLLLDEVDALPQAVQQRLVAALGDGPRDGADSVRLLGTTRHDLQTRCRDGAFDSRLYQRLAELQVDMPPLRERVEDIPLLSEHFLRLHQRRAQRAGTRPRLRPEALDALLCYPWPGNVRELASEMGRLSLLGEREAELTPDLLSARVRACRPAPAPESPNDADTGPARDAERDGERGLLRETLEGVERELIHKGLVRTGGNKSQLARELGISRSNLLAKVERYGLES